MDKVQCRNYMSFSKPLCNPVVSRDTLSILQERHGDSTESHTINLQQSHKET